MILDGKKISNELKEEIKIEVEELVKSTGKRPGLAVVIVGENKASQIYVNSKVKTCNELGIESFHAVLPEDSTEEELLAKIEELNCDERVHGILVQLPLPKHISEKKIIDAIKPSKDVDCFTVENIGRVFLNEEGAVMPCTPAGVMEILKRYNLEIAGKNAVIIGRSNIVGKPLALMMINSGATVTVCNSKTKNLKEVTKGADILVVAIGKDRFVTEDMVKEGAVVIDVGINRVDGKIYGDVDYDSVAPKALAITPVPGGVGPMTIAILMENCLKLFKRN